MPTRPAAPRGRRAGLVIAVGALCAALLTASVEPRASARSETSKGRDQTVVLVHGAWADSSSWSGVVRRLQRDGYVVDVFPTPLRGLATDTAALREYLATIRGPIVLVGHSYGGAVVTDAATGNPSVRALVYVDAFAPDDGQPVAALAGPQSVLADPDPTQVFTFVPATLPPTPATDLYVLTARFPAWFANDLPHREGAVLAATQRPVTFGALGEPSTAPAWRSIPSWYEVGTIDKVIPPSAQLAMARHAGAHVVRERTGHLPMISAPGAVTHTIERAARATD